MSVVVGIINGKGVTISADTRETYRDGTRVDGVEKTFKHGDVIVGCAGTIETELHGKTIRTLDRIEQLASSGTAGEDFGHATWIALKDAFPAGSSAMLNLLVGWLENGIPKMSVVTISNGCYSESMTETNSMVCCGEIWFVPRRSDHYSNLVARLSLKEAKEKAEFVVEETRRHMEAYGAENLLGRGVTISTDSRTVQLSAKA